MILVGLGNTYRRDDGVGPALLARMKDVPSRYCEGDPLRLMAALDGEEGAILVDALEGPQPGRVHRWAWGETPTERPSPRVSSHAMSLLETLQLMENLNRLPARVVVYGLEGEDFSWGEGFSPKVEEALGLLEQRVRAEMAV